MNKAELDQFFELRKRLFGAIQQIVEGDCQCKSYEGAFEIGVEYKDFFEDLDGIDRKPSGYWIRLNCYVIGPGRHYTWYGDTFSEALSKCKKEVERWIKYYDE